mmetsp:Transcript_3228/g.5017  ORF Transcript_3228/g.5017 Transcript_3228/m.5017 type:complete len:89 (-) Transcript_3228:326-592(-)
MVSSNVTSFPFESELTMPVKLIAVTGAATVEREGTSCLVDWQKEDKDLVSDSLKGKTYSCVRRTWFPVPFWGENATTLPNTSAKKRTC